MGVYFAEINKFCSDLFSYFMYMMKNTGLRYKNGIKDAWDARRMNVAKTTNQE